MGNLNICSSKQKIQNVEVCKIIILWEMNGNDVTWEGSKGKSMAQITYMCMGTI